MFKQVVGQSAVVRKGGVYRTCDLYEYKGQLFAKHGNGYVRLNADGGSSVDGLALDLLAYEGPLFADKFGRLCVVAGEGFKALTANPDGTIAPLLLEGPK